MYYCQTCSKTLKHSLIDMGKLPIANHLQTSKKEKSKTYPLEVFLCKKCSLFQLGKRLSPKTIFNNYFYHSSYSSSLLNHAKNFVKKVGKEIDFSQNNFVIEIASNDGYLLKNF